VKTCLLSLWCLFSWAGADAPDQSLIRRGSELTLAGDFAQRVDDLSASPAFHAAPVAGVSGAKTAKAIVSGHKAFYARDAASAPTFELTLADGESIVVKVTSLHRQEPQGAPYVKKSGKAPSSTPEPTTVIMSGEVDGRPGSHAGLIYKAGTLSGQIDLDGNETYRIVSTGEGRYRADLVKNVTVENIDGEGR
jgi:hypothetical protein